MKIFIASDLHGSAFWCEKMLDAYRSEKADRMLLLGDILYHGPRNDLPEGYAPKTVIALLSAMKEKILCVRGNCEAEVDQMVLPFPVMADYAVMPVGDRLMYITHGHTHNMKSGLPLQRGDILLHGHTHVPACEVFGQENVYLNPGSTSIPKEQSHHGYMTLEDGTFLWKDMDGAIKNEYKA